MLSLVLDPESEQYLVEILAQERATSSELIKALLRDRWRSLRPQSTILERMGGYSSVLVAFYNANDRYHLQVKDFFAASRSRLMTTLAYVAEVM